MEISIIIPIYNTEQYLKECLDSVIAQEFKYWECILIDDGSSDNSGYICDLYVKQDNRFKVYHTINSGVSAARNLGISNASGKYIAFIDSDDTVDKEYLSELYMAMIDTKVELIVCGMKLIRPSGTEINGTIENLITIGNEGANHFVELNRKSLLYGPVVKLYRSDIIKDNKIKFPSGIQYGEDLIFNLEYLNYVTDIFTIDSVGYNYRILSSGTLSSSVHKNHKNNYEQWKMIRSFFKKRGINDVSAHVYLSNRLWGIVYNLVMGNKLSMKELEGAFSNELANDLKTFNNCTIVIPVWLKLAISKRMYCMMWLIQRRA